MRAQVGKVHRTQLPCNKRVSIGGFVKILPTPLWSCLVFQRPLFLSPLTQIDAANCGPTQIQFYISYAAARWNMWRVEPWGKAGREPNRRLNEIDMRIPLFPLRVEVRVTGDRCR